MHVVSQNRRPAPAGITSPAPRLDLDGLALYEGDALELLPAFAPASVDALITDPPYSSGGLTAASRTRDPAEKYCQDKNARGRPSFGGDMRDQRSFLAWGTLWGIACRRLLKPGAYALIFTDWRQLPTVTDLLQAAGFVWRGIIAWDKGRGARAPHKGYFRHQCEYVVWGTNGACDPQPSGPWDGCLRESVRQADKFHMTGKPTPLMQQLVTCAPEGGLVLDCFAGSGTTGVACAQTGRRFLGIEQSAEYCAIAEGRLRESISSGRPSSPVAGR